MQLIKLAL